jgi:hypothetical protein
VNYSQAAELVNLLRAAFPNMRGKLEQDTVDLWLAELRKLPHQTGSEAVRALIGTSTFWPAPAELYEQVAIIRDTQVRALREQARREANEAFDSVTMPPLREIPAAVELLRRFATPLTLDRVPDGTCDDCGRVGPRYRLGRVRVCAEHGQQRLHAAARLEQATPKEAA